VLTYATPEAFAEAYEKELERGGVFMWSEREQTPNSILNLEIDAAFAGRQLAFECRVVHVMAEPGRWGVALMFLDASSAKQALAGLLGK
jgi:hypothetical protein